MPLSEIAINQGTYKTQSPLSLRNSAYAQDLINLMIDNSGTNYDRPTLELFTTLDSIQIIGIYRFDNRLIAVTFDRKVWAIDDNGTPTEITNKQLLPGNDRPIFTDDGQTLFIVGGAEPIKWVGVGNFVEQLGGSPPDMTHIRYLDGYLIGNRRITSENNKVIQFSEPDLPETWIGTSIFSAQADPDEVVAIEISQREIYVIGESTIELWQNVGTSPVPFARSFVWQSGTSARDSVVAADSSIFLLDDNRRIIRYAGRQRVRVSEQIEEELAKYETVDDCVAYSFNFNGSTHIQYVFPTAGKCWSMDLKNNQWTEWRGFKNGWVRPRINAGYHVSSQESTYAGDFDTGKIWKYSETNKTDAGGIFKRQRTFSYRDGGAKIRKQAYRLRVNLERDIASGYEGEESVTNPTLEIRWKDDGKGWSEFRQVKLGEKGIEKDYVEINRLGIYRNRQYEIQFSDPSPLSIVSIETEEEVLGS